MPSTVNHQCRVRRHDFVLRPLGLVLALSIFVSGVGHAATVVTAYRDFNGNGTRETGEPGLPGASVIAYNAAGATISGTTGNDGTATLATVNGTAYRVEVAAPSLCPWEPPVVQVKLPMCNLEAIQQGPAI
jgi:hypothetical protein